MLQRAFHERATDDYLLLHEHPHVYTLGSSAKAEHVLRDPASVGAELVRGRPRRRRDVPRTRPAGRLPDRHPRRVARGPARRRRVRAPARGRADRGAALTSASRRSASRVHGRLGTGRGSDEFEKIAAIGVRVARGRTRHGFALNVDPDLTMFDHIVPCGITDRGVTSMARVLGAAPPMRAVADRVVARFAERVRLRRARSSRRGVGAPGPPGTGLGRDHADAGSAPSGCGSAPAWTASSSSSRSWCATRTSTPSARKRAARTSTSAGPTGPRRS